MTERQTVFVTGGSTGIGAALVRDLSAAGHTVAFTYWNSVEAANALTGETVRAYRCDVRDPDDVERAVDDALEDFETIDAVVCNAGITRIGLMATMSDEDWRDVIDTNLSGAFYVCRQFLPHFLARRSGRFVLVSSVAMHGMAGQAGYCASKAGLAGLSAAIAKEYGPKGISCNTVALGLVDGGLANATMGEPMMERWRTHCPAGRLGALQEAAAAIRYLISPESSFVNGAVLPVTGGLNEVP